LEVGGTDSLQTIIDRLKELDAPIRATIINDGSEVNGYRLSLTSKISGQAGEMIYNAGGTDLELFEIIRAQDAVLSVGGAGTSNTIVTRSNTNTFSNVIPGLTLEVQGVSDTPVTVTVSQDVDTVVEKVQKFVDDFNAVLDQIDEYSKYDSETEQAGVLLGSMQTDLIRNRLYSAVRKSLSDVGDLQRLSQVGISVGSGAKLQFDEEAFRDLYSKDPESIEKLFSTFDQKGYAAAVAKGGANVDKFYSQTNMGFGYVLDHVLDLLTRNNDGVITHLMDNYDERKTILSDRMDYLKEMMSRKEERLYRQFYNMELALSRMQGMQSALSSFTPIVPMNTNTGSNGTSQ
jgi:flagellar hook-associated protein 2